MRYYALGMLLLRALEVLLAVFLVISLAVALRGRRR
jgi:hypothetical protein